MKAPSFSFWKGSATVAGAMQIYPERHQKKCVCTCEDMELGGQMRRYMCTAIVHILRIL